MGRKTEGTMKLLIISDIHDNLHALDQAISFCKTENIETVLFCGDFCSPIPCRMLAQSGLQVHAVFGNGDGDRFAMSGIAANHPNLNLHGEWAELGIMKRKIALTHYPIYAQALARTGDYDAVFSGHTHEKHRETFGDTLWVNPGEIMAWKAQASAFIYDPATNDGHYVYFD